MFEVQRDRVADLADEPAIRSRIEKGHQAVPARQRIAQDLARVALARYVAIEEAFGRPPGPERMVGHEVMRAGDAAVQARALDRKSVV